MAAIKPALCKGAGVIHQETQTQWSLPNNPSCYKLYNDHKKTCTDSLQDRTTVTPHQTQQPVWKVVANNLFSPIWGTQASFTLVPLCSATYGVIWPFLTHENKLFICLCTYRYSDTCWVFYISCMELPHRAGSIRPSEETRPKTKLKYCLLLLLCSKPKITPQRTRQI